MNLDITTKESLKCTPVLITIQQESKFGIIVVIREVATTLNDNILHPRTTKDQITTSEIQETRTDPDNYSTKSHHDIKSLTIDARTTVLVTESTNKITTITILTYLHTLVRIRINAVVAGNLEGE